MKKKENKTIEQLVQEKLYNAEAEIDPRTWSTIESRLPKHYATPFYLKTKNWIIATASAAAIILAIFSLQKPEQAPVQSFQAQHALTKPTPSSAQPVPQSIQSTTLPSTTLAQATPRSISKAEKRSNTNKTTTSKKENISKANKETTLQTKKENKQTTPTTLIASKTTPTTKAEKTKEKRWSIGMGGGSISATSFSAAAPTPTVLSDYTMLRSSAIPYSDETLEKSNIEHNLPISVGLGISYKLTNHWSISSGLQYSYLKSKWNTNYQYYTDIEQKLHFIGIPLAVNYTIAQWSSLSMYASAGILAEINVAGEQEISIYSADLNTIVSQYRERERMQQLQWSANINVGLSYPLLKYVNAFAELGAGYYFNNGSTIESYYTNKNIIPNARLGLRLGF